MTVQAAGMGEGGNISGGIGNIVTASTAPSFMPARIMVRVIAEGLQAVRVLPVVVPVVMTRSKSRHTLGYMVFLCKETL